MAFSMMPEDSPKLRRDHYGRVEAAMRHETIELVRKTIQSIDPAMRHHLANYAMEDDGWRAFIKPLCANYMLAYNYMLGVLDRNGNRVFHVEKDLAEALYHTDIEISVDDIHLPFPAFSIYLDGDVLKHIGEYSPPFNPQEKTVQEYSISYIMVEFLKSPYSEHGKFLRLVFGYLDPGTDPDDIQNWNNSTFLELELDGTGKFKPKDGEKAGLGHFFPPDSIFTKEQKEKAKRNNEAIINFIFSLMLYIENKQEDVVLQHAVKRPEITTKKAKKARRQAKAFEDETKYNVYHIGRKYSGAFQASKAQTGSLGHRVIVRGHWREQWYGKKSLQEDGTRLPGEYQKQIWIEPFFKGSGDETGKGAVFEVT